MQRRPPHKTAHAPCPYGAFNWADCDIASAHQWGRCEAMVGKYEPEPCSRWAFGEEGYCGQHYVALKDGELRAKAIAIARAGLDARIDAYIEWREEYPSVWDRGMAAGAGLEPATSRVTTDRSTTELPRKGPHKLSPTDL